MGEVTKYRTLRTVSTGEYKEKGSKFIGIASPCNSREEAEQFIEQWKQEHHKASQFCFAYRIGTKQEIIRFNDDSEPTNSAGKPIFGQIKAYELTNVVVEVVRYYGGVKLGVGGLINAYRTAAKTAIEAGEILQKEVEEHFALYFDYSAMPFVMDFLKKKKVKIIEQKFDVACYLEIRLPLRKSEEITNELMQFESLKSKKIDTV